MAILAVIGSNGSIYQKTDKSWSYPAGEGVQEVYRGIYAQVKSAYDAYKAVAGYTPSIDQLSLTYDKGIGTLTVSYVEDGPVQYELVANQFTEPVENHSGFNALSAAEKNAVRIAYELGGGQVNPIRYVGKSDTVQAYPFDGSAMNATAAKLYAMLNNGQTTYQRSAYVLRSTQVVSKRSQVKAAYTNVNAVEAPPDTSSVNTLIGSLPSGEWLKQAPTVRMYGNRKWQIAQEWWWAPAWSALLYGGTATP